LTVQSKRLDEVVGFASVLLVSLAAVLSAACGYEAARWNQLATRSYNQASVFRVSATQMRARSNALTTIDVGLYVQYIVAGFTGHEALKQYLAAHMRPEMRPALRAWLSTRPFVNPKAPSSPFTMPEYRLKTDADAAAWERRADETAKTAAGASEQSTSFVLLTVIFAGVSFLAGISTRFRAPGHLAAVVVGLCVLTYGLFTLTRQAFR
jgi:hypothetical protein